jgi:hypothetical protein
MRCLGHEPLRAVVEKVHGASPTAGPTSKQLAAKFLARSAEHEPFVEKVHAEPSGSIKTR